MKVKVYSEEINIPELQDFEIEYPQFAAVVKDEGKFLFNTVMSPQAFIGAKVFTKIGLPAVTSVAKPCYDESEKRGIKLTGRMKQSIGTMICLLMTSNGYNKTGKQKSIPHKQFSTGEIYVKK